MAKTGPFFCPSRVASVRAIGSSHFDFPRVLSDSSVHIYYSAVKIKCLPITYVFDRLPTAKLIESSQMKVKVDVADPKSGRPRDRSPGFPYISLSASVERLTEMHQQYQRHPARLDNLAPIWNFSAGSSALLRNVAALKYFGLVDVEGTGKNRKVSVSDLGVRIIADARPGAREKSLEKAFGNCKILAEHYNKWGKNRPPTEECISELTIENGFTEAAAHKFINVYDESIKYANIDSPDTGEGENPNPNDHIHDEKPLGEFGQEGNKMPPIRQEVGMKQETFVLDTGTVTIQWPAKITEENFEDFKSWLKLLERRIGRNVTKESRNQHNSAAEDH